jgi:hypothetical protein
MPPNDLVVLVIDQALKFMGICLSRSFRCESRTDTVPADRREAATNELMKPQLMPALKEVLVGSLKRGTFHN